MDIIARGAEAILYRDGENLVKERIKKGYRIDQLDSKLISERTKREAKILGEVRRAGVNAPRIIKIKNNTLIMEFIDGIRLKEYINKTGNVDIAEDIGKQVGLMHKNNFIHGDLTTSNMILSNEKVFFIDFGLGDYSTKNEDKGTDISLIKEAFKSTHFKYLDELWVRFIKGYKQNNDRAEEVLKALKAIEKRGRYVER